MFVIGGVTSCHTDTQPEITGLLTLPYQRLYLPCVPFLDTILTIGDISIKPSSCTYAIPYCKNLIGRWGFLTIVYRISIIQTRDIQVPFLYVSVAIQYYQQQQNRQYNNNLLL